MDVLESKKIEKDSERDRERMKSKEVQRKPSIQSYTEPQETVLFALQFALSSNSNSGKCAVAVGWSNEQELNVDEKNVEKYT